MPRLKPRFIGVLAPTPTTPEIYMRFAFQKVGFDVEILSIGEGNLEVNTVISLIKDQMQSGAKLLVLWEALPEHLSLAEQLNRGAAELFDRGVPIIRLALSSYYLDQIAFCHRRSWLDTWVPRSKGPIEFAEAFIRRHPEFV